LHNNKRDHSTSRNLGRSNDRFILGTRNRKNDDTDSMTELAGNAIPISKTSLQ
jgi:hypothetical protein